MLILHDFLDFFLTIRASKERCVESFSRGECPSGFVDYRFDISRACPFILCLDMVGFSLMIDLCIESSHFVRLNEQILLYSSVSRYQAFFPEEFPQIFVQPAEGEEGMAWLPERFFTPCSG